MKYEAVVFDVRQSTCTMAQVARRVKGKLPHKRESMNVQSTVSSVLHEVDERTLA